MRGCAMSQRGQLQVNSYPRLQIYRAEGDIVRIQDRRDCHTEAPLVGKHLDRTAVRDYSQIQLLPHRTDVIGPHRKQKSASIRVVDN